MTTVIKAIYEDGIFKPEEPVALADKVHVRLVIQPSGGEGPSPSWSSWQAIIGIVDDPEGPTDVSENHDHYLYGAPKKR